MPPSSLTAVGCADHDAGMQNIFPGLVRASGDTLALPPSSTRGGSPFTALPARGAAAAAAPVQGEAGDAGEAEDATGDLHLSEVGDKKVDVIKAVRAITGLGLKDAKGLVDEAPSVIKEGIKKTEADEYGEFYDWI